MVVRLAFSRMARMVGRIDRGRPDSSIFQTHRWNRPFTRFRREVVQLSVAHEEGHYGRRVEHNDLQ